MGRESWRCGLGLHGGELGEESVRLNKSARTSLMSSSSSSSMMNTREDGRKEEKKEEADDRTQPSQLLSDTPLPARPVKPHDWTYSSCHTGQIAGPSVCPLTLSIFIRLFLLRFSCSTSWH
jgi:hypothetical protein